VSFIAFTSFRPIHSFNLIHLRTLLDDDPEGTLEVVEKAQTGQDLVKINSLHRAPPWMNFTKRQP
jgi:hypothetical protein